MKKMLRSISFLTILSFIFIIAGCGGGGGGASNPVTVSDNSCTASTQCSNAQYCSSNQCVSCSTINETDGICCNGESLTSADCGGTARDSYTIEGTFTDTGSSRIQGRIAYDTTPIANKELFAYIIGDTSNTNLITSSSNSTDQNGQFSITIGVPTGTTPDIVIEALIDDANPSNNFKIAFDNINASMTGANAVTGDEGTTRKARVFELISSEALSDITIIDNTFHGVNIDITSTITTSELAQDLFDFIEPIILGVDSSQPSCPMSSGSPDYDCIYDQIDQSIDSSQADTNVNTLCKELQVKAGADGLNSLSDSQSKSSVEYVVAIFDDADRKISGDNSDVDIDTESEITELVSKMDEAIAAWLATYSTQTAKRVVIKDSALSYLNGSSFTNNDVKSAMTTLKASLQQKIQTVAAQATTLVAETDMGSTIAAYDILRGMLIEVMVEDCAATREDATAAVESLLLVLAQLGEASEEATSKDSLMDIFVEEWDDPTLENNLMTALAPLEMDDPEKTQDLMRLAHDLSDLPSGATDQQIEDVLDDYLDQATTDEAMGLYTYYKDKECQLQVQSFPFQLNTVDCPTEEEIIHLIETHYGKDLPKLRAFVDGIQDWMYDSSNAASMLALYNAGRENGPVQNIYNGMKASESNKQEISGALTIAGIKPEIFWLVMNCEQYLL